MLAEDVLPSTSTANRNPHYTSHPLNSSRLLLELVSLAQPQADSGNGWDAIIQRNALRTLMMTLQYRDPTIVNHSRRVATLGVAIGQYLGWEGLPLQTLEAACLLHDIGKIGIPDMILQKPGRLAPEESELMRLTDEIACDVLQACRAHEEIIQIVSQMHLHFNGATHGFSAVGSDVHLGARILAVVDAYDSLVTPQVFRDKYPHNEAMDILHRGAGSQFDGNVISALSRWFEYSGVPTHLYESSPDYQLGADEILRAGSMSQVFSYLYLLESLYDGFYVSDPEGRLLVWSAGMSALQGVSWRKVRAGYVPDFIQYRNKYGETLAANDYPIRTALEQGRPQTTELQMLHCNDGWSAAEVQTLPLIDGHGRLQGFAEIVRDLSGKLAKEKAGDRDLRLMASRDALTHVANRGELKAQLELRMREFHDSQFEKPFSVIFLDVDHFKKCNDTYGHAAGDEVLVSIARLLQHETYSGELVARYGGEEFVVLCPETKLDEAFGKAERLRTAIAQARVVSTNTFKVTSSFGVAQVEPDDTTDSVLQRADKGLYMSKRQGRNRTNKLTSEALRKADPNMVEPPVAAVDAWRFEAKFRACLAVNMAVYKFKAIVDEVGGKLLEVKPNEVKMRFGSKGIVPFWGSSPDRQPVEVLISIGDERSLLTRGASKLAEIGVVITPVGWVTNNDTFQFRARNVLKELREYFAAEYETQ